MPAKLFSKNQMYLELICQKNVSKIKCDPTVLGTCFALLKTVPFLALGLSAVCDCGIS